MWLYVERYGYYGADDMLIDRHEAQRLRGITIATTSFEDFLRADLPSFLQSALAPAPRSPLTVFQAIARPGTPNAIATSQAMAEQGFEVPKGTTATRHNMVKFIGNH